MRKINNLKKYVKEGLKLIKKEKDIKEAEVFVAENERFVGRLNYSSVVLNDGIQELKSDAFSGTSVKAVFKTKKGIKVGFGSEDKEISLEAVKRALIKARRNAIADANFKSLPRPIKEKPILKNYHDPKLMEGDEALFTKLTWRGLEGALRTFKGAGLNKNDYLNITGDITILKEQMAVANSHGICDYDQSTLLMATITTMIENEESKGTGWVSSNKLSQFKPEKAGEMAAKSAINTIKGKRLKSGHYNVIFNYQPVCALFSNLIVPCFSLDTVVLNISPLKGKLDQKIMSEEISFYDDGTISGQVASKRITDEGIPTGRTQLVKEGKLEGFLANSYFGNQMKDSRFIPRNGFRFGGGGRWHRYEPRIYATNIVIEGEKPKSFNELLKKVKDGVLIGRLWYLYPINGLGSGDFTGTVIGDSYLIKNGKIVSSLKPNAVRINENWLRLMRDNILGISGERKPILDWGSEEVVIAPRIAFSNISLEEIDTFMDGSLTK